MNLIVNFNRSLVKNFIHFNINAELQGASTSADPWREVLAHRSCLTVSVSFTLKS